jgi:hypothetical protein
MAAIVREVVLLANATIQRTIFQFLEHLHLPLRFHLTGVHL